MTIRPSWFHRHPWIYAEDQLSPMRTVDMKESVGSPSFGCEASEPHDSEPATSTSEHFLSRPFAWVAENVGPCVLAVARSSTNEAVPVPTYGSPDGLLGAFKHLTREFSWSGRRESNSRSQLGNHAEAELRTTANKRGRSATCRTLANGHERTRMCHKRAMVPTVLGRGLCRIRAAGA